MNEALQLWSENFARDPETAFDRLVRGVVPLGTVGMLSFGEILDALFEPGDATLDTAAASWLEKSILGPVPSGTSLHRWASVLEEYFRGIALMELPKTGEILRSHPKRIRLWLQGFYEGADRDPESAYLTALARVQNEQQFSSLWRRLILGEESAERTCLGIGMLGFRKMPGLDGRESADVPEGLLQALVELADKPGTRQAKWKQTMRGLFATYRRTANYWVEHLAPLLPHYQQQSKAREWLSALLPGIPHWRPPAEEAQVPVRRARQVPVHMSQEWARRVRENPALCETPSFLDFLDQHRVYAKMTGDSEYINKTFNNLATSIIRGDGNRAAMAVLLMEEALEWAPWNPHNWTSYAIVLCAAQREGEAINVLWKARHRFAWDVFIRTELGRVLRENGYSAASEGVFREAVSQFPGNVVCRSSLAETLRARGRVNDACKVFEQACRDFPSDIVCRNGLADLFIDLNKVEDAERLYREALAIDELNSYARGGLARVLSVQSARTGNEKIRDEAKSILRKLADEGNQDAMNRLQGFDEQWLRARTDPAITFRRETGGLQQQARPHERARVIAEMSVAERLGRAMIDLWQAERAEDPASRSAFCTHATALLDMPEDQIDDDLLCGFVETRGLVLLAGGDARRALAYFEEQIQHYGRGGWIGIRIGEQRARIILGEPAADVDTTETPGSQSANFALHVVRVIHKLSCAPHASEVRDLLQELYPVAAQLTARVRPDAENGQAIESGAEMLGAFLQTRWFRPVGIQSVEDLNRADLLQAVVDRINGSKIDAFDVISNSTLAHAA